MDVLLKVLAGVFAISSSTYGNAALSKQKCIFTGQTNVVLYKYPPFLLDPAEITIESLVNGQKPSIKCKELMECFLRSCLGSADIVWNISAATKESELIAKLHDNRTSIAYPVPLHVGSQYLENVSKSNEDDDGANFVAVKLSKIQAHFVNIKNCRTDLSHVIFSMIWKQWPIFTLMLLLAGVAGVIVWLLESRENDGEFATSFYPGGFDGFWWAFISMTTVGYGDKTPRSLFGRLFSVLWIFLGITIVSFFTATITSAITIATVKKSCEQIGNRTIAVLSLQSGLKSHVQSNGGEVKEYSIKNIIRMFQDVNKEKSKIGSMLIDVAIANHYAEEISKMKNIKKVKAVDISKSQPVFYVMIRSNVTTPCSNGDYELDRVEESKDSNKKQIEYAELEEEVVQPLSLESPGTQPFMYSLFVGLIGMIILGSVRDMVVRLKRRHSRSKSLHESVLQSCIEDGSSSTAESSAAISQTRNALGTLTKEMKEMKKLMQKNIERLATIEKLVESRNKRE